MLTSKINPLEFTELYNNALPFAHINFLNLFDEDNLSLIFNYDTEDYISSISIEENLDLVFSISYKDYNKEWAYDLKCVSLKKD